MNYGNHLDFSSIKKALIIKLRHHGDVVLSTPVFSFLKSRCPHITIDALVYKDSFSLLEHHSAISSIFTYDRAWKSKSFLYKWRKEISLYWKLREQKYDLVLNLTEGDRGALMAYFSKARYKAGFESLGQGFWGKDDVYTHLVKRCPTPRHSVERDLDVIRRVGLFPEEEEKKVELFLPNEDEVFVKEFLQSKGVSSPYIVIHPISRWRFKCPPMSWFAALIRALQSKNMPVVISASSDPGEMAKVQEILSALPSSLSIPVISSAGVLTLRQLGALIKNAHFLISVDSVPIHMASAFKTPVAALFGPTSELNWGPWQHPKGYVIQEPLSCRPCHLDGCGGSKVSQCLSRLPIDAILNLI